MTDANQTDDQANRAETDADADRILLTDGGENDAKVIGKTSDTDGVGLYGEATGTGDTYGVWGQASNGYGLGTSGDAKIDGNLVGSTLTGGNSLSSLTGVGLDINSGSLLVNFGDASDLDAAGEISSGAVGTTELNTPFTDLSTLFGDPVTTGANIDLDGSVLSDGSGDVTIQGGTGNGVTIETDSGSRTLKLGVPASDGVQKAGGNVVAGHPNNAVNNSAVGVVIGGGGAENGDENTVGDDYATVAGGRNNEANNEATVSGGKNNSASGSGATVPGGYNNVADGSLSIACGNRAEAFDSNAFVWNDGYRYHSFESSNLDGLSSSKAVDGESVTGGSTFSASADDGFRFITGANNAAGPNVVTLAGDGSAELTFHNGLPSEDATAVNINSNGKLVKATSSARYKTNIEPLSTDTSAVLDLEPKTFEYEDSGQQSTGLIAEEVDEVLPDLVHYDEEGRPESVNYDRVGVYLVPEVEENRDRLDDVEEATADHGATIETLEATLDAKDQRIEDQQDRIDRLESRVEQKDDRIDDLETETDELRTENEQLREENEALRERVAAIEAKLGIDTAQQATADD